MKPLKERVSWLMLQLCCLLSASTALNCSDHTELLIAQTKCFYDQGINFTLPNMSGVSKGLDARFLWMEAIIVQKAPELCLRQKEYKAAIECDMRISLNCVHKDQQENIPDQKALDLVMPAVCNEKNKTNFRCAKTKIKPLMACSAPKSLPEKAQATSPEAAHNVMCKFFEEHHHCQINIIMECGCNTVKILDLLLREMIYPLTCPPMAGGPVRCDPAKVGYMESSGKSLAQHCAFSVFISFVLIALELVA